MVSRNVVRHNRRLAFTTGVNDALAAPATQRRAEVRQVLRRHPGVALATLSRPTLRRVLVALGFTAAAAAVATTFPSLPSGGPAALAPTPAGNASAAARSWSNRAWSMLPSRTQATNVGGLIAVAWNPMNIFYAMAASTTARTQDAMQHTLETYEDSVNKAAAKLNMYLSWTMFIAFLAVISHFIPRIALNIRRTVHVLTSGNAEQVCLMAGNVATKAIGQGGRSRSRSRSKSRSRARPTPRALPAPPPRRTLTAPPVSVRRLPSNAELLARLN